MTIDAGGGIPGRGGVTLVLTTFGDQESAGTVARRLLEERLVACANILPGVRSLYWWEDKIADENEVIVLLKSDRHAIDRLYGRIAELHPYSTPELVEIPLGAVDPAYERWVLESTRIEV
jgi:periplasmic divalent cation tolerance protein